MACREPGGSKILLYFGFFLLAADTVCQCSQLARLKASVKLRHDDPLIPNEGDVSYSGKLLISQKIAPPNKAMIHILDADSDYQADMGWDVYRQPSMQDDNFSKADKAVTDQLIKMDPKVECTTDSMKLRVQDLSNPASLLWVDRGSLSPLSLFKLPQSCGYTIRSTQKEMVLVAPYNGCFITQEEDSYVLPLLWWGLPVKMTCPLMRPSSSSQPMVTCLTEGMIVKTEWFVPPSRIKINVNGKWELINAALHKCGIGVVENAEGVVLSVHYGACVEKEDGQYSVELAGEGATKISCPSMAPGLPEYTKSPTHKPSHLFPYPLNPTPGPVADPIQKPTADPHKTEVPPGHVENPYYPFLPNPQTDDKPSKDIKMVPSHKPAKPHIPEVPSGNFLKPSTFLPNPLSESKPSKDTKIVPSSQLKVKPGQGAKPASPNNPFYPLRTPDAKPTTYPQPQNPEAPTIPAGQPLHPYLHPFFPENEPQPYQPQGPEKPPGKVHQPHNPYPSSPMPGSGHKRNDKPTPASQQPEDPPVQMQLPKYPYTYPLYPKPKVPPGQVQEPIYQYAYPYPYQLYPLPNPKEQVKKPTLDPQNPEGSPDAVHQPPKRHPYLVYPLASPKEPTKKPLPNPQMSQVTPGQVQLPPNLYANPVYHMPSTKEPTKRPMPNQQKPEVTPGKVGEPIDLYPYPLYPMPGPKEPTKRPMPNPQKYKVTPGQVDEQIDPYPYPLYPMPSPKKPTKRPMPNPQKPEVTAGQVDEPMDPYPYPRYPLPSPKEPTNKPMPEVPPDQVVQPADPYHYPIHTHIRFSPEEPTKMPMPSPQKPDSPPDPVLHPANAYHYPLYPIPSPKEPTKKTMYNPKKPEVPSSQVEQPTYLYPYPLYPMPSPKEPAKKPMPQLWPFKPQISAHGPVKQSTNPNQYPLYPKPGPKEPAKKQMPNPWLIKPQQPKVPNGHVKQPVDSYPFLLYPRPSLKEPAKKQMPDPWPFKPQELGVPHGQAKQPSHPYPFPLYPKPSRKEPAKKPVLDPWLLKPEAPLGHVVRPAYPLWHESKLVAKPAQPSQPSAFPPSMVQQPHNPYLVYPIPDPEFPKKPLPFPQPPDSKRPEIPGNVREPANFFHQSFGAVIKKPLKPEVPGNVHWSLEPQTPVKPDHATHANKNISKKHEDVKHAPIQPPEGEMPHPQWQQPVTLPPAKELQQATPPPQPTNGAMVPQGSKSGCIQFCAFGFSNCCPQINFHQHLYLSSPGQSGKLTRVVSQEFPFDASMAYHGPGNRIGYALPAQNPNEEKYNPEKAADSVPNKNQPYHQPPGGNSASLSGTIPDKVASERPGYPYLALEPNSQFSSWPYENSPNLPPSLSPEVMPFRVQNPFYTPVNQEEQKYPKKPNGQFRVFNYPPGVNARSPLAHYLQQQNPKRMPAPSGFSFGSDGPSHLGFQEELGPLLPYSMLNDAESAKNTSFTQNVSHRNKQKKSSKRDHTGHSSESKGYVLLQRGPPGREPRGSMEFKNNFRVVLNQNVPGHHLPRPPNLQHVNPWNSKPLLEGSIKSSKNYFKPKRSQTNPALVRGSKELSSTNMIGPSQ